MDNTAKAELPKSSDRTIHTYRWNPPKDIPVRPHGIYLLHGMGEYAARYERLANRLAALGWRVGAHDHPGHGRSDGSRGVANPPDAFVTQALQQLEVFSEECATKPVLFGHSLGGVVALQLVLQRSAPVVGLMLSAPAIVPRVSLSNRLKLQVLGALAPSFAAKLPYDARILTHDTDEITAAESDEFIHGYKSAGLIRWLIDSAHEAIEHADRIPVPTLLMIAGSDQLIDIAQTRRFAAQIPAKLLTQHHYAEYHHEILNETPERRERVMADIVSWLESRQL